MSIKARPGTAAPFAAKNADLIWGAVDATAPQSQPGSNALLTPAEAALRLRVKERVLERWRATGEGPQFVRLSRKSIRYRDEDLVAFVLAGVRSNTIP